MSRSEREQPATTPRNRRNWQRTALGLREVGASNGLTSETPQLATELTAEPLEPLEPTSRSDVATHAESEADLDETFAARLRYLFATTRQPAGRPWSANAVARASRGRLTAQAVYSLYRGATPNPKLETILALAEVLSVDPEYFVSPGALGRLKATHTGQYATLEADPNITFVSRRMGRMTPEDKAIIVKMVERLTEKPARKDPASEPFDAALGAQMRQDLPPDLP
ncbi:MAG: hypothetical protein ACRDID_20850 [Ktedonobacterales bacterium]